jgi:hypothetical protein
MKQVGVVGPLVQAVVLAPGGALPTSCHPLYPLDGEMLLAYSEQVSDPASFKHFLDSWLENRHEV